MSETNRMIHTPEGVRDIYTGECGRRLAVQERILKVLYSYGYEQIQTPSFEFMETFRQDRGSAGSREMFKFFDRDNNTLVLRPDMTPAIARCVAKYFKDETMPLRLCYLERTYKNNSSYQGRLKERTETGAELIGDNCADADGEMIALVTACLKASGLEEFKVELGQARFYQRLLEEAGLLQYEISNFSRMGYQCRHNMGYWEGEDYLGLGPGATSTLGGRRWTNAADLAAWAEAVRRHAVAADAEELTLTDRVLELIMLRLRTARGLRVKAYRELTGRDLLRDHKDLIHALHRHGLIRIRNGYLWLTRNGMLVSNSILERFFDCARERLTEGGPAVRSAVTEARRAEGQVGETSGTKGC